MKVEKINLKEVFPSLEQAAEITTYIIAGGLLKVKESSCYAEKLISAYFIKLQLFNKLKLKLYYY